MKNLKQLCLFLSVGSIATLSIGACSDDPATSGNTAGMATGGTTPTAGTPAGGTASTAGTPAGGTTSTAGTPAGGTASTAGTASGGSGGASGGSGGASGGKGGTGGASGGSGGKAGAGGTGGGGGSGGAAGPMCPDIEGPSTDSATCATYCTDAVATCGAEASTMMKVKDAQTCATFCATFTQTQLCCRAYHVKNAATGKDPHCKHTVGIESCQ